jgi:RNA polymerase sigma-70 factor (ECF subfamily)
LSEDKKKEELKQEVRIIEAAQKDARLFAPLYDKYYTQIFRFIYKRVSDRDLSADLTSQTFLKAMVNIGKYKFQGFPFSSWLYRIASNEVNMHYRSAKKVVQVSIRESDVNELIDEIDEETDQHKKRLLIEVLNELPLEDTHLIELRFFEKYSFREIGQMTGITEGNAKIKTYRVVEKLKKLVNLKNNERNA